jgi:hypothetical protein
MNLFLKFIHGAGEMFRRKTKVDEMVRGALCFYLTLMDFLLSNLYPPLLPLSYFMC